MKGLLSWFLVSALLLSMVPAGAAAEPLTAPPRVDAGDCFSAALDEGGAARARGSNSAGQLRDGTTTSRYEAAPVLESVADMDAVSISTPEQLASIGADPAYPLDGSYVLAADLDLSGYASWTPIGTYAAPFTGTFDGQGHVISHLTIDDLLAYGGLFGRVSATGVIRNLGLEQVSIRISGAVDGTCYVGGIAGQMGGNMDSTAELRSCYVTGSITAQLSYGSLCLGGLAGELDADVSDCFNLASLSGAAGSSALQSDKLYMGGVAGMIDTYLPDPYVVERCFNEGSLTPSAAQSDAFVGGVAGYLSTRVVVR